MTPQEALKIRNNPTFEDVDNDELAKCIDEALEKQIPKTAEHEDGAWSICPNCGGSVCNDTEHAVNKEVSYCEHCGQALDWEQSNVTET